MSDLLQLHRQNANVSARVQDLQNKSRTIIERPLSGSGLKIEGTEKLYAVIILREYDEDGDLVAIGDESDPLPTGHTLKPTWQELTEITVVSDMRYDSSTHQIQKKTRTFHVPLSEDESAWTMITGGQASTGCT